ncbi:MAG: heme biosynthesis HemY N-terminal domain-containing protein [Sulfurifustis sp.]
MRFVLVVIGVLFAAIFLTLAALKDPGYVLIARMPWSIEMSIPVFVIATLLGVIAFLLAAYLIVRLLRIPRDVTRWRLKRNHQRSREALVDGLVKLAEANWVEAEASLLAGMRDAETPVLGYLAAACVSQGQGNLEKRDEYLAAAHRAAPDHHLAIGMTQASLQYLAHQSEQALATLSELRRVAPKHKNVLRLLAQLYLELRDWTNLVELIPQLRLQQAMTVREIDALELRAHRELLVLTLPTGSLEPLQKAWNAVPKHLRNHPAFIAIYARHLIEQKQITTAERLLRESLEKEWDDALVDLYGRTGGEGAAEQLETAESWLGLHPANPTLLLALGRLAMRAKLDQKAIGYLERCVNLHGPIEAYAELGGLLERLGETERALACYRRVTEIRTEEARLVPIRRPSAIALSRQRAIH